jgi:hypothetical protein
MIIDTNHIQTHAELPDISSRHNRDAAQHEPNGLPAHVTADSLQPVITTREMLFYKRRKLVDRFAVRCEITFVVKNT